MIDTEKLEQAARTELIFLWGDLHQARQAAYSGSWSMGCDSLVERITELTAILGPTPWSEVPVPLLQQGIYQRVHEEMGVEVSVDMEELARICADYEASVGF